MIDLRFTLVTDGSSDAALVPILTWLLRANNVRLAIQSEWADLRAFSKLRKRKLADKIILSLELFPCDLLFIHRDAEKMPRKKRVQEINNAIAKVRKELFFPPAICVVPVRMLEAWLLFDEMAIRHAAGNRSSQNPLNLPRLSTIESIPNPKSILYDSLKKASHLTRRRLKRFPVSQRAHRLAGLIDDFSPLRVLPAFKALENDLIRLIEKQKWNS